MTFKSGLAMCVFTMGGLCLLHGEDWEQIALETDEPAYAMRITSITPGSQAESAGLAIGDYVYRIGDRGVAGFVGTAWTREREETLHFCRKGGRQASVLVQPGPLGVDYEAVLRPQLGYLRREIGTRDPRWDPAVVLALSKLQSDPPIAVELWSAVKALAYPSDDLDAFVTAYCGWRNGAETSIKQALDRIDAGGKTLPRLYAAILEDMAYATGETDVMVRLYSLDPASSQVPDLLVENWSKFDSSPLPKHSLLEAAIESRGRDLRDEILPTIGENPGDRERQLTHLRQKTRFNPGPGHYALAGFRIPPDVMDFHYSVAFRASVPEYHEKFISEVRVQVDTEPVEHLPSSRLAHLSVKSMQDGRAVVDAAGGYSAQSREFPYPGPQNPIPGNPNAEELELPEVRFDIIRRGREIAAYCNGFPYCRLPIDPKIPNSEFRFFTCGVDARLTDFQIWALGSTGDGASPSVTAVEHDAVKPLRSAFEAGWAASQKPAIDLSRSYAGALTRLLEAETKKGALENVLKVRAEIEAFGDGSTFTPSRFSDRTTDFAPLAALRDKYLAERERLWKEGRTAREQLLAGIRSKALSVQLAQTKLGNVDAALAVREFIKAMESDRRFEDPPAEGAIPAILHFAAKGEILFFHNGRSLACQNSAENPRQYTDGTSEEFVLTPGEVLQFRMRSDSVYRALVMAIESRNGTRSIPIAREQVRYLGKSSGDVPPTIDAAALARIETLPEEGKPDDATVAMWMGKKISDVSRGSGWMNCGAKSEWHDYALVIEKDMIIDAASGR